MYGLFGVTPSCLSSENNTALTVVDGFVDNIKRVACSRPMGTSNRREADNEATFLNGLDPYVHSRMRFSDVTKNLCPQKRCVMCSRKKKKMNTVGKNKGSKHGKSKQKPSKESNRRTRFFCGRCCVLAPTEQERFPSKHGYCDKCFPVHVANCNRYAATHGTHIIPFHVARTPLDDDEFRFVAMEDVKNLSLVKDLGRETKNPKRKGRLGRSFSNKRQKTSDDNEGDIDMPPISQVRIEGINSPPSEIGNVSAITADFGDTMTYFAGKNSKKRKNKRNNSDKPGNKNAERIIISKDKAGAMKKEVGV